MRGRTLGPYLIEKELGSGGMGKVYLARVVEPAAGTPEGGRVALKLLHPQLLARTGFFKRFLREAEIGMAVRHPNVVRTLDCDALLDEGTQHNFLVMEYVEGQTLCELRDELGRVPEELCRHIGREVARGLAAIHATGAIHRDLKPANVLITADHVVKVMDLGVALLAEEAARLSQTGVFVGSIQYAAPEQFRKGGADVDARADLHALGVLLYELAAGRHPWPGEDFGAVMCQILETEPPRLGEVNPQLSPFYEEVVHTLLAKDREKRIPSADELRSILDAGEDSAWWQGRRSQIRKMTRRPLRRIRIPRETSVYGREEEMARLRSHFERAVAGEGQVVLLEGEAGIGKTRLVDEMIGRLLKEGVDPNFLFGTYPPGGAATSAGAFITAYREHFKDDDMASALAGHLADSPALAPAFSALLRGDPPPTGASVLTKDSVQTAFVHTARSLAAERTTVLLIDDLHFTSGEGRALFAALAHAVPGHRLLLVGTARHGLEDEWLAGLERLPQFSRLQLPRLGAKDLGRLLVEAFSSEQLARELSLQIATKSDGNPFFVFEIIQELRETGTLKRGRDGTWSTTRSVDEIVIPSSVKDLLRSRISGLDEDEHEMLDVAACCGFEFDPTLVAEVMGLARIPALRRFAHIEGTHRLVRSVARRFVFDHHQVQEILYESLPEPLREEYHLVLAQALAARLPAGEPRGAAAVEVCDHYLRSGAREAAVPFLEPALDHLKSGFQTEAALGLADRALDSPGALEGRLRLAVLIRALGHLDTLSRREEQRARLDEAIELSESVGDPALRARVLNARGWFLIGVSRYEEAAAVLENALETAREATDLREEGRASQDLGIACFYLGRYEAAGEHHARHLRLARAACDRRSEANALGNLGNVNFVLGRTSEAEARYLEWLGISNETGDRRAEAAATGNLGAIREHQGRFEEALNLHERNRSLCAEIGYRAGLSRALGNLGMTLRSLGRYAESRRELTEYLQLARSTSHAQGEAVSSIHLAQIEVELGDLETARDRKEAGLELARGIGSPSLLGEAWNSAGWVACMTGDHDEAARSFAQALEVRRTTGPPEVVAETLTWIGRVRLADGRDREAVPPLEEALSLAQTHGDAGRIVLASACLALAGALDGEKARRRFDEFGSVLPHGERMEASYLLHRATGDTSLLADAHRLLTERLEQSAEEHREASLRDVTLHREIDEAFAGT